MAEHCRDYPVISSFLEPGDIIFSRIRETTSKRVRKITRPLSWSGAWSHAAFVISPDIRFEAPGPTRAAGFYRRAIDGLGQIGNGYAARLLEPCSELKVLRRKGSDGSIDMFWSAANGIMGLRYPRLSDWNRNVVLGLRHLALGRLSPDPQHMTVFCSQAIYFILTRQHPGLGHCRGRDILSPSALFDYLHDHGWGEPAQKIQRAPKLEWLPVIGFDPKHSIELESQRLMWALNNTLMRKVVVRRTLGRRRPVGRTIVEVQWAQPKSDTEFRARCAPVLAWWNKLHQTPAGASLEHLGAGRFFSRPIDPPPGKTVIWREYRD